MFLRFWDLVIGGLDVGGCCYVAILTLVIIALLRMCGVCLRRGGCVLGRASGVGSMLEVTVSRRCTVQTRGGGRSRGSKGRQICCGSVARRSFLGTGPGGRSVVSFSRVGVRSLESGNVTRARTRTVKLLAGSVLATGNGPVGLGGLSRVFGGGLGRSFSCALLVLSRGGGIVGDCKRAGSVRA